MRQYSCESSRIASMWADSSGASSSSSASVASFESADTLL